jgi:hypothetical protein
VTCVWGAEVRGEVTRRDEYDREYSLKRDSCETRTDFFGRVVTSRAFPPRDLARNRVEKSTGSVTS